MSEISPELFKSLKTYIIEHGDLNYITIANEIFNFNFDRVLEISYNSLQLRETFKDIDSGKSGEPLSLIKTIAFRKFFKNSVNVRNTRHL